jgi:modification methylase
MPTRTKTSQSRRDTPSSNCIATTTPRSRVKQASASAPTRDARRGAHSRREPYRTADLPLAIWACAQKTSQWQRHGRYLPQSNRHPGKMLPALARNAIEAYSEPGDLIVDPFCGIGTTLVEAIHLGRRAIGVELEDRWGKLARANIQHVHNQGATTEAEVIQGDARHLHQLLVTHASRSPRRGAGRARAPRGQADLILTSPPYACQISDVSTENLKRGTGPISRDDTRNYSPDKRNLGHARGDAYLTAVGDIYQACAETLKPGGFLVLVTKDMRSKGALRNLSGQTINLCEHAGLQYWQRIIGLLATVRDNEIVMRPSFWQTLQARRARERGEQTHVVAHEDILVFRKPNRPSA